MHHTSVSASVTKKRMGLAIQHIVQRGLGAATHTQGSL